MVNYKLLLELVKERGEEYTPADVIEELAMWDIPMSDAVIQLGIACGVLTEGYRNGWSGEV